MASRGKGRAGLDWNCVCACAETVARTVRAMAVVVLCGADCGHSRRNKTRRCGKSAAWDVGEIKLTLLCTSRGEVASVFSFFLTEECTYDVVNPFEELLECHA